MGVQLQADWALGVCLATTATPACATSASASTASASTTATATCSAASASAAACSTATVLVMEVVASHAVMVATAGVSMARAGQQQSWCCWQRGALR
jgi:hypothetical protein